MERTVNGELVEWTPEIVAQWEGVMRDVQDERPVTSANYFTPRPYRNEYDRGSSDTGFTYTRGREVFQVVLPRD